MIANPELRRYAWLELGWHRIVAVPVVLAVLAGMVLALADDGADTLAGVSITVFAIVTAGWGMMRAFSSVVEEVQDRTWDFQRMSAVDPLTMALGKVFGSTLLAWYIGACCLFVYVVAGLKAGTPQLLATLVLSISTAVLLHSLGVASSALTARTAMAARSRRLAGFGMLFGGIWLLPMLLALGMGPTQDTVVHWWMLHGWPLRRFAALSALLFALWAVFAAWRAMARELREPPWWWGWPAFAAFCAFWWAGLSTPALPAPRLADVLALASVVLCVATYVGLSLGPLTPVSWARLRRLALQPGRPWHQRRPLWLLHALLALALALLALAATALTSGGAVRLVPRQMEWMVPTSVLALVLMALRDAAVVSCFTLTTRMRRPVQLAAFYLLVADLVLPAFLLAIEQPGLARIVFPLWGLTEGGWGAVAGIGAHLAVAAGVLWWRVKRARLE